jgi:hypothetical protein
VGTSCRWSTLNGHIRNVWCLCLPFSSRLVLLCSSIVLQFVYHAWININRSSFGWRNGSHNRSSFGWRSGSLLNWSLIVNISCINLQAFEVRPLSWMHASRNRFHWSVDGISKCTIIISKTDSVISLSKANIHSYFKPNLI